MFTMEGFPSVLYVRGVFFLLISYTPFSPLFLHTSPAGYCLSVFTTTCTVCVFLRLMMVGLLYFDMDLFVIVVFLSYHGDEGYGLNERWLACIFQFLICFIASV